MPGFFLQYQNVYRDKNNHVRLGPKLRSKALADVAATQTEEVFGWTCTDLLTHKTPITKADNRGLAWRRLSR